MPESKQEILYLRMAPHLCVMGGGDQEMFRVVELRAVFLTFCGGPVTAAAMDETIVVMFSLYMYVSTAVRELSLRHI